MNPEISYSLANVTLPKFPLWTALVTPFAECGAIDFASLSRIARQQAAAGNGLLLLGSTGEALSLSPEQQFGIVNYVVELNLNCSNHGWCWRLSINAAVRLDRAL